MKLCNLRPSISVPWVNQDGHALKEARYQLNLDGASKTQYFKE
ncbi:hypothetical protein [Pseudomonas frederiksbergensis]|nr:hypothetical protein [Pseudomonas frederiksbergensis]